MAKGKSYVLEMARVIYNYELAHRPGRPRCEQTKAHAELLKLAKKLRKWTE